MISKEQGFSSSAHEKRPARARHSSTKRGALWFLFLLVSLWISLTAGHTQAIGTARYREARPISSSASGEVDPFHYLPIVRRSAYLTIANFDTCGPPNNLGGDMGAACPQAGCQLPNSLTERYVAVEPNNCAVRIEYHIQEWAAFWLQLLHADLTPYSVLSFDLKAVAAVGVPNRIRIELKRDCRQTNNGTDCREISITYVENVNDGWQQVHAPLSDFQDTGWPGYQAIQDWSDIEELVFTFDASESGRDGAVFLDNIQLAINNE